MELYINCHGSTERGKDGHGLREGNFTALLFLQAEPVEAEAPMKTQESEK